MRISVVLDCHDVDALVPFWEAAMGYQLTDRLDPFRVLTPKAGEPEGPVLLLQQVPEPKVGKSRVHIDLHPEHPVDHIRTLESLGATRLGGPVSSFGFEWQTMLDPEGHEFCVVAHGRLDLPSSDEVASDVT